MTDYIQLLGTEDVTRAGREISSAAESMRQTVGHLDEGNMRFLAQLEELVSRFEAATEKLAALPTRTPEVLEPEEGIVKSTDPIEKHPERCGCDECVYFSDDGELRFRNGDRVPDAALSPPEEPESKEDSPFDVTPKWK